MTAVPWRIVPLLAAVIDIRDGDWRDLALCAEIDPERWFPEKGASTREAKQVCRKCDVRAECLAYALRNGEREGIWGGMSDRERRRIGRQAAA